jgi:hypothetical protein
MQAQAVRSSASVVTAVSTRPGGTILPDPSKSVTGDPDVDRELLTLGRIVREIRDSHRRRQLSNAGTARGKGDG